MAQTQLIWTDVDSSNVESVAYDDDTQIMGVKFHNGGLYAYETIEMDVYVGLVHAESVGKYLHNVVKAGAYPYTKLYSEQELLAFIDARRK